MSPELGGVHETEHGGRFRLSARIVLGVILAVATLLRGYHLGRTSFWYDEVVTMRLARSAGPSALIALMGQIDATRAPLHPLLLQAWVRLFGVSEASARSLSVVCGVLTVWLVYRIGHHAYGDLRVGLWAAWLAALSPLLIVYARETRMYAWLVLVTCACWDALFALRTSSSCSRLALYAFLLVLLGYSHPLGLVMAATLGLVMLVHLRSFGRNGRSWVLVHGASALALAPWVGRYLDHEPEWTIGRLSPRFLLGVPIAYVGGNFLTLAGFAVVIAFGVVRFARDPRRVSVDEPVAVFCLGTWLVVPPLFLYAYSWLAHPIFGPARYTLFVAPAYLILLARGLAKLPPVAAVAVGSLAAVLSASMWPWLVFAPDIRSGWREASTTIGRLDPTGNIPVLVMTSNPGRNFEVETARYYLETRRPVLPMPVNRDGLPDWHSTPGRRAWVSIPVRDDRPVAEVPRFLTPVGPPIEFAGLQLIPVEWPSPSLPSR